MPVDIDAFDPFVDDLEPPPARYCSVCRGMHREENSTCERCRQIIEAAQRPCTECGEPARVVTLRTRVVTMRNYYSGPSCRAESQERCANCEIQCRSCGHYLDNTPGGYEGAQALLVHNGREYEPTAACQSCYGRYSTECPECHRVFHRYSTNSDIEGNPICYECTTTHYVSCNRCDEYIRRNDALISQMTGHHVCDSCDRRESNGDYDEPEEEEEEYDSFGSNRSCDYVHSYDYRPMPKFFSQTGEADSRATGLYHGIELEVGWNEGYKRDFAQAVTGPLGDLAYLKRDGSITDAGVGDGFEIVTHPCKLGVYREVMPAICDGKIPHLLSHNAGEGLGLHISANKNFLTNTAIARICAFIGADRNEAWLVKLARRKSDNWAKIIKKDRIEDTLKKYRDGTEYIDRGSSRYEAVNLQNDSHIEFRLFRGTLKFSSLMLCLEFVNALCLWCMQKEEPANYQSASHLLAFAQDHAEDYPHLIDFMTKHCTNVGGE